MHNGYTLRFGFPYRLFPSTVNHFGLLSRSWSLLHYRGTVTDMKQLFLITATLRNMNPVRKRPSSLSSQSTDIGSDRLVPHSDSRLSLHQSLASMSSVSTRWFT